MHVAINLLFFQRYTMTFSVGGRNGGMTTIGEGDWALEKMEELIRCLETTVQLLVQIFLSMLIILMYPFSDEFNCPVKSRTKHVPIRPIR